ncbi:unnamed protein product [Microthlaspi erraticum]|uniref:F-box domain-containing protein n=1 Tax=Microthlaspi erraticum TaxID=1685480 RepID=A0A6D2HHP2_9BRAS|nr:unnamed protein product [Microthlaspi erraticum]
MDWRSLPGDLVEDILSRVPAKSLARLRSTSYQWNVQLKSLFFAKKQSAKAPTEESLTIILMDFRVFLVKINLRGIHGNNVAPAFKVVAQLYLKDPFTYSSSQVDIRNVFPSCDGLLLCTTKDDRLVVWNPCSGVTKWIKPRNSYDEYDKFALGYHNKSSCKQYKILRVAYRQGQDNEYEIHDFTTDSWRVIDVKTINVWLSPYCPDRGVSVKGNTYWIALDTTQVVREEQLCLLGMDDEDAHSHVWVTTTSPGSVLSWSKILTLNNRFTMFNTAVSFLVDEENKALVCCNQYSTTGTRSSNTCTFWEKINTYDMWFSMVEMY